MLSLQNVINIKIMAILYIVFILSVLNPTCTFTLTVHLNSDELMSMLNSHVSLVANVLDSPGLKIPLLNQ